jgi:diaminohydroxyphosphoribosylaminopyrimidine deaminase/5-amino-6-(5-phosphoribosylamino)uracil reductase
LPPTTRLVLTAKPAPVLISHFADADPQKRAELERLGCQCFAVPPHASPEPRPSDVLPLLQDLGHRRFTNILVEGGSRVLGSFFDAREVDEVWTFMAPKWIGDPHAPSPLSGVGINLMAHVGQLRDVSVENLEGDAWVRGLVRK